MLKPFKYDSLSFSFLNLTLFLFHQGGLIYIPEYAPLYSCGMSCTSSDHSTFDPQGVTVMDNGVFSSSTRKKKLQYK